MTSQRVPQVRLYTYVMSPFAAKVHCFLLYKRVPFETFYVNPLRAKEHLPVGRQVPVVTIDDESLGDSTPIGLWLDERFPEAPRLLPEAGDEREALLKIDDWKDPLRSTTRGFEAFSPIAPRPTFRQAPALGRGPQAVALVAP